MALQGLIESYPVLTSVIAFLLGNLFRPVVDRLGRWLSDYFLGTGRTKPDYDKEDQKDEWPIYEIAYLLNDKDPPTYENRHDTWRGEIRRVHGELHDAKRNDKLNGTLKSGAYFVEREELKRYCEEKGLKPPFLFPEVR